MNSRKGMLAALPLIGVLTFASQVQAYTFNASGDGINVSGWFTVGPDPHIGSSFGTGDSPSPPGYVGLADPLNAQQITGAGGTFSDSNYGLNLVNEKIVGIISNNYLPHFEDDPNLPFSFSWWTGLSAPLLSYDNLFYAGSAAPVTCNGVPAGGLLDNYGMLLLLQNGDVADIWSDGGAGDMIYGAAVANATAILDYEDTYPGNPAWSGPPAANELTFTAVPETSTWGMMVFGFAALGFAGYRKSHKAVAARAKPINP